MNGIVSPGLHCETIYNLTWNMCYDVFIFFILFNTTTDHQKYEPSSQPALPCLFEKTFLQHYPNEEFIIQNILLYSLTNLISSDEK